jgi:hypothetical protein
MMPEFIGSRGSDMRMRVLFLLCVVLGTPVEASSATPDFSAGQVWAYRTRPGEEMSRLLIDKVEDDRSHLPHKCNGHTHWEDGRICQDGCHLDCGFPHPFASGSTDVGLQVARP